MPRPWTIALVLLICAGCGGGAKPAIRLVLISPHRDEIREEVALAFPGWFHARTVERLETAAQRVTEWQAEPSAARAGAADRAVAQFLQDWRPDEVAALISAFRSWQQNRDAAGANRLRDEIRTTRDRLPEVEIVWQDVGGTSQISKFVSSSFNNLSAGVEGIGIDLLFGGGTDIYLRFARDGFLQKLDLPPQLLARIPPQLNGVPVYDPEGRWFGPMLSSFGILCNRRVLERIGQPEPRRWADLGRPELAGWVAAGDPRQTGSVHMVYEIILQGQGWDAGFRQLLRLGANAHGFIRDSGTLTRQVSSGEVAAAGNLDANALSAVGRDPEGMAFNLPPGATIVNPDALAVLRGAPHPELARVFVEFTLSDAGQRLFILLPGQPGGPRRYPLCRLSVVPDLYRQYPPAERSIGAADPFALAGTISYDAKKGSARWDALNDLFGAVIVDAHPDLAAAWRAVLDSPCSESERQALEEQLFAPPCTEAELLEHAGRIAGGNPRLRAEAVNRWGEEARQRYRAIRRAAREGRRP
jgi:ABC-type Fe3+ transport system substrate-binding protein